MFTVILDPSGQLKRGDRIDDVEIAKLAVNYRLPDGLCLRVSHFLSATVKHGRLVREDDLVLYSHPAGSWVWFDLDPTAFRQGFTAQRENGHGHTAPPDSLDPTQWMSWRMGYRRAKALPVAVMEE